jgi:hypothetical protein
MRRRRGGAERREGGAQNEEEEKGRRKTKEKRGGGGGGHLMEETAFMTSFAGSALSSSWKEGNAKKGKEGRRKIKRWKVRRRGTHAYLLPVVPDEDARDKGHGVGQQQLQGDLERGKDVEEGGKGRC